MRTYHPKSLALLMCLALGAHLACAAEPSSWKAGVAQLNERRAYAPLWFSGQRLTPAARSLLRELNEADSRGLRPEDYDSARLETLAETLERDLQPRPAAVTALDVSLSLSAARFVLDLHAGRVNPRDVGYDLDVPQAKLDVGAALVALAATPDLGSALDLLEPRFRHYALLKKSLAEYRALGDAARTRKIELTLERVRWLPATLDSPPIIVNIPQFRLFAFRTTDDFAQDILQMDVIVGATFAGRETPVFAADMRYVVLRPYWDVPTSILRKELLPLIQARPRWIEANGYEMVRGQTDAAPVVPVSPESIAQLAAGKLRLRQKPGPANALGVVKFMLPNRHNVYLHDTPAQALFKEPRRAFSHGCIRVSHPMGLLAHVLRDDPEWPAERIQAALESRQTLRIPLRKSIRVFIVYGTALATEAGETLFFEDIYHHDARLQAALDERSAQLAQERR